MFMKPSLLYYTPLYILCNHMIKILTVRQNKNETYAFHCTGLWTEWHHSCFTRKKVHALRVVCCNYKIKSTNACGSYQNEGFLSAIMCEMITCSAFLFPHLLIRKLNCSLGNIKSKHRNKVIQNFLMLRTQYKNQLDRTLPFICFHHFNITTST